MEFGIFQNVIEKIMTFVFFVVFLAFLRDF